MILTSEEINTLASKVALDIIKRMKFDSDQLIIDTGLEYISSIFRLVLYKRIGEYFYHYNQELVDAVVEKAINILEKEFSLALKYVPKQLKEGYKEIYTPNKITRYRDV